MQIRNGPDGIHIFNRESGANILIDELIPSKETWANAPRQISIALTNSCNLHCHYCYAPKNSHSLDSKQLCAWLRELDAGGCLGVGFGGGEPTLHKDLHILCEYINKNTKMAVTLTTNGILFNAKLASELKGHVHFVRVSMDGVGKTYEKLRGVPFEIFVNRLNIITTVGKFGINYVVNSDTVHDIYAAIKMAEDIGASEFLLLPEHSTKISKGIDGESLHMLRTFVGQYRGPMPLSISEYKADGFPVCKPLANEPPLQAYAHIDASGILRRSSFSNHGIAIKNKGIIRSLEMLEQL